MSRLRIRISISPDGFAAGGKDVTLAGGANAARPQAAQLRFVRPAA